jgi:hypothetical protein
MYRLFLPTDGRRRAAAEVEMMVVEGLIVLVSQIDNVSLSEVLLFVHFSSSTVVSMTGIVFDVGA